MDTRQPDLSASQTPAPIARGSTSSVLAVIHEEARTLLAAADVPAAVQAFLAEPTSLDGDEQQVRASAQAFFAAYREQQATDAQQAEELAWVQQTLAGDQAAFARLVERYSSAVYTHAYFRLGNAPDAEDAVQEIFHRAYTRLHTFDQSRRLRAWLMTIATNYCTDVQRGWNALKRQVQQWVNLDDVDYWLADTAETPDRIAQRNERDATLRRMLQRLPDKYRLVLTLYYWNDMTYQEIVEVTGLPENTIKTHLRRGRMQLKQLLEAAAETNEEAL